MFDWPDDESVEEIEKDFVQLYGPALREDQFIDDLDDLDKEEDPPSRPVDEFEERIIEVIIY